MAGMVAEPGWLLARAVERDPSTPPRHTPARRRLPAGPAPGPAWGVTALPPGMDESSMDPKLLAIMRAQQGR